MLDNIIYRTINDRKNKKGESMKNEKIGVGFHLVANDVYESYDKGEEPKEKDLKELYELSKEFVKDYEEREPQTSLLEDLEDLVGQLQSDKITEDQVVEILSNIVKYENDKRKTDLAKWNKEKQIYE